MVDFRVTFCFVLDVVFLSMEYRSCDEEDDRLAFGDGNIQFICDLEDAFMYFRCQSFSLGLCGLVDRVKGNFVTVITVPSFCSTPIAYTG